MYTIVYVHTRKQLRIYPLYPFVNAVTGWFTAAALVTKGPLPVPIAAEQHSATTALSTLD